MTNCIISKDLVVIGDCYHNNITQLDTVSLQWRELEPTDATRPVMMKMMVVAMISLEHDGVHHLLMIRGYGSETSCTTTTL